MSDISNKSWGLTVLRVAVGIVFMAHGWQKMFGFGIHGVTGMMTSLGIPLPGVAAVVLTVVELFGGLALVLGVATRAAAILLAIDMLVAILKVHLKNGFFMPGVEYAFSLLAASICLALAGPGAACLDEKIGRKTLA